MCQLAGSLAHNIQIFANVAGFEKRPTTENKCLDIADAEFSDCPATHFANIVFYAVGGSMIVKPH